MIETFTQEEASIMNDWLTSGELTVVASRPSNGKVGWTIKKLMDISNEKIILAFSLEASKKQFEYMSKNNPLANFANWEIRDLKTVTLEEIKDIVISAKNEKQVDIVYIDNLDFLSINNKKINKKSDYHEVVEFLKNLCEEQSLTLVAGKGLPDDIDKREDKRPMLADIKLNKPTKAIIDNIIGLYREEVYSSNSKNTIEINFLQSKVDVTNSEYKEHYNIR
jgi:replicative DNA helicase